ncbi:macrophage colony-stimulating factor 1 receptor 1 isoform X2 [Salmo trutta]|uniref:macrophage colony-stimulating factor 1 receptor 1 isoform X2 n=1 Tax=Salmo trutta TaxID=8032 RepID=UPI001130634D|nr:macrophage colony-stimulating factor 1 receptor 1-like isoform X2 [Salmo trutta]
MLSLALFLGIMLCTAQERSPPVIRLNSVLLREAERTLPLGTSFTLTCEGDSTATWSTTAFKRRNTKQGSMITTRHLTADYTGTYKCVYDNQPDLFSEVHIYVKDPINILVTPRNMRDVKEGGDLLLCQLTDPSATDLSLRMANGDPTPPDMNYTVSPRRGILIRNLLTSHSANYICSAKINGVTTRSKDITINVVQRLRWPPSVLIEVDGYVSIVGEELLIPCITSNPNHFYNVTWKHSSLKALNFLQKVMQDKQVHITSTVTIPAVTMSDTGNFTCTAMNEAGANRSTTYLQVVDEPYIRLIPRLSPNLYQNGSLVNVKEGENLEISILIEAYPQIKEHWWDVPMSHSHNISTHGDTWTAQDNYRYESSLLLHRVRSEERGQYTLHTRSARLNSSITFNIQVYQKPSAMLRLKNSTTLICTSSGYPAPTILWYQCPGIQSTCDADNDTVEVQPLFTSTMEVQSELTLSPSTEEVTVECVTFNFAGKNRDIFVSHVLATTSSTFVMSELFTPTLIGATSTAAFLFLLLVIVLYKYKQKPKYEVRWKIIEANDGNNYTFIDPTQLPYNKKWEFPRDKLRLGQILGAGAFGKVVEATAYGLGTDDNMTTRVAVKMLKPSAHSEEREALMSELKILSHLGCHDNIVNLLGACTQGGPMLMITEYCSHGDLLNFLRGKAKLFLDSILSGPGVPEVPGDSDHYKNTCSQESRVRSDSGISCSSSDNYQDMHPAQRPKYCPMGSLCEDPETDTWSLDIEDLLRFSYQVAQGMDFLASKNCIHRDVAARNVLLTDGHVAKICDFGLARDIENDSNYVVKGNARLPVKWMAPESIFDCVYTVQSDVWSYGILLWEVFSLGKSPYPNIVVDTRFYKMIKDGCHMSQPDFAPPEIYTIMKMCWNMEPTVRPTFSTIGQLIQSLLPDQPDQTNRNVQDKTPQQEAGEQCDQAKISEDCDQTLNHEEEEQPLMMRNNNYQFC